MRKILRNGLNNYKNRSSRDERNRRKVLTVEVAEQWIADEDSHDLNEFTIIDMGAESWVNTPDGSTSMA